jgi:hypothetical protein
MTGTSTVQIIRFLSQQELAVGRYRYRYKHVRIKKRSVLRNDRADTSTVQLVMILSQRKRDLQWVPVPVPTHAY